MNGSDELGDDCDEKQGEQKKFHSSVCMNSASKWFSSFQRVKPFGRGENAQGSHS